MGKVKPLLNDVLRIFADDPETGDSLAHALREAADRLDALEAENRRLQDSDVCLREALAQYESFTEALSCCQAERDSLKEDNAKLEAHLALRREDVVQATRHAEVQSNLIADFKAKVEALEARVKELEADLSRQKGYTQEVGAVANEKIARVAKLEEALTDCYGPLVAWSATYQNNMKLKAVHPEHAELIERVQGLTKVMEPSNA